MPSTQDIVNWIAEGINYLENHPDVIENSFCVCGIRTNDPDKVRNDEFLKRSKTNWQMKKKNFLRMKVLFRAYNRLIMIV